MEKREGLRTWEKNLQQYSKNVTYYLLHSKRLNKQNLYYRILKPVRIGMLEMVMKHCNGHQVQTAQLLGISRGALRKYLRHYFDMNDLSWAVDPHKPASLRKDASLKSLARAQDRKVNVQRKGMKLGGGQNLFNKNTNGRDV